MLSDSNPEFEALLDYLKESRGCDLTSYKRSTLIRRFQHRMQSIKVDNYRDYLQYLQHHSEEYLALFNDILINFTSFFRDRDAWDYLATEIIPKIISSKQPEEPIRIWSAGCATGQEIYSVAILFAEALGVESYLKQVQCYATDADEVALEQARQATYSNADVVGIPQNLLQKYFGETERGYVVHLFLRQKIIFGHHDLTKHAPMSKIDLLLCRNVLIYFKPEAQSAILVRLHFALRDTGFLLLGKSEMLVNRNQIFTPIHMKHRVFIKGLKLKLQEHLSITPKAQKKRATESLMTQNPFWRTAFETSPIAQFAIDPDGYLLGANEQANLLFGLKLDDWSYPFHELEPGKLVDSHISLKATYCNRRPTTLKNIEWNTVQGIRYFDVTLVPVLASKKQLLGSILSFIDKTDSQQLVEEWKYTNAELERFSEALQATQTELEAAHQEIEILIGNTDQIS